MGEFQKLLADCAEIAEWFPDGVAFIGGIAVYLYAVNGKSTKDLAETTHDADFYISLADMADLRDIEEVTPNRRLSKHQMIKHGIEFDIYTERQSRLIVPFDAVMAESEVIEGIRLASLEHLLALKLEAYSDRKGTSKGEKDARDLLRICAVATDREQPFRASIAQVYLGGEHLALLQDVVKSPQALVLAHGNAQVAKRIRGCAQSVLDSLREEGDRAEPSWSPSS